MEHLAEMEVPVDALDGRPWLIRGALIGRSDGGRVRGDLGDLGDRDREPTFPGGARRVTDRRLGLGAREQPRERGVDGGGGGTERSRALGEVLARASGTTGDAPGVLDIGQELLREGERAGCGGAGEADPLAFGRAHGARHVR